MSPQAQFIIILWVPFVLYLFYRLDYPKAVLISFIAGWLFLPQQVEFAFPLLPNYTKLSATCYSVLFGICLFDIRRFNSFKFRWLDLPIIVWCLCTIASSVTNGLGLYDGFCEFLIRILNYGLPYFIGRMYFSDLKGVRQLAIGIFLGGLAYIPLCLLEVAISPQLHRMVYGYHGLKGFAQSIRYGGYRPNVFMQHGLAVGMWMMAATLIAIWLWQAKVIRRLGAFNQVFNIFWVVLALVMTVVVVKSTGAYFYLIYGIVILLAAKWLKTGLPLAIMIGMISFYLFIGATGTLTAERSDKIVTIVGDITEPDRASSLDFRLHNEEILGERARERMVFGWGGWNRNRVYEYNEDGELEDITTTDSLWIIAFGVNGLVGLISVFGSSLLPALYFWLRYPASLWFNPQVGSAAVLAAVTVLYMLDCTLNNLPNPVFTLASGALAGLVLCEEHLKFIPPKGSLDPIKIEHFPDSI